MTDRNLSFDPDLWISRCWRRLRFGQFLKSAADWLAIYLLAFGTTVLLVKLAAPALWPDTLWLAIGTIPVVVVAWLSSANHQFSKSDSVALLDSRLEAGGLLMTLSEAPDDEWEAHLPHLEGLWQTSLPQILPVRFARQLAGPTLFFAAVCFVPLRPIEAVVEARPTVAQQAASQLEELLTELDDAEVLEQEEKQQIEDEIRKLVEETRDTPLTHEKWEIVDALQERMRMKVDVSAGKLAQAQDSLGALQSALGGDLLTLSIDSLERLEKNATESLEKLQKAGSFKHAPKELQDLLERLTKNGKFQLPEDAAERAELLEQLGEFLDQESDRLTDLRNKCDGQGGKCGECQPCDEGCTCKAAGDADCICAECKRGQCSSCHSGASGNRPGRGGVSRGRGDADLTWGDEASLEGTRFKESILPPGMMDKPADEVIGLTIAEPTAEPADRVSRNAARTETAAAGEETWDRTVRPRHRTVLRKYFGQKLQD